MIQSNTRVISVGSTEGTLLNLVDCALYARCFWFQNLDDVTDMTLKFQASTDGGNTWGDLIPDNETDPLFAVGAGSMVFKKVTNSNLLRIRGTGEGLLQFTVVRYYSDDAITVRI